MGTKVNLTKNHNNANIKVNVLPDDKMREIGFTDFNPKSWYFCRLGVGGLDDISFSISIPKDNPSDWCIDILDENFLQPYDYQAMIERKTDNDIPYRVQKDVEHWMEYLKESGIISGHEYGEYI